MASDEDLAVRLAEGDEAALEELLRRYRRPLAAFLARRTAGRDVDDLFQETWLRVVRSSERFDRSRRFSTWLFQIATNLSRDWWRRNRRALAESNVEAIDPTGSAEPSLDRLTADGLLALLPDEQREVLILRYYHDMSEAEIAAILDCPRGTVKSRAHNALARLGAYLKESER